jgi:hypothetical protein
MLHFLKNSVADKKGIDACFLCRVWRGFEFLMRRGDSPKNPEAGRIDVTVAESATHRDHIAPRRGSHFLLTFCWLGQKVRRRAGALPAVLLLGLPEKKITQAMRFVPQHILLAANYGQGWRFAAGVETTGGDPGERLSTINVFWA